ncbi:MAG: diguanylate cyclase [Ignavibacteriales bacterium CG_4_9_14_3_um_filter_34_10]|nr:MAG: diguanylate cyclase [Ignavibacteriales bacterium CG_4_9_14_3_um_filter_34_10]
MMLDKRNKKRLLIFILIPLLCVVPIVTDDLVLEIISALIIIIYVGFIIFLRDSIRTPELAKIEEDEVSPQIQDPYSNAGHDVDVNEDFKIISPNTKIEILREDELSNNVIPNRKNYFKPPDLKEKYENIANEKLPTEISNNEHFSFILTRMLNAIKDSFISHNALFFWYKSSDQKLILEQFAACGDKISQQRFQLEDDVLSKIAKNGEPELLTNISSAAEKDVIRYYVAPQSIKSFVGVPLYYDNKIYGVLALDSLSPDCFGLETVYTLGKFVRIISIIITLFEEKVIENQSQSRLNALLNIISAENKFETESDLFQAIENAVNVLLSWDIFTFVFYNFHEQKFYVAKVQNKTSSLKYVGENLLIDLNGTIVGKAIVTGMPVNIDDLSKVEIPRFSINENITIDGSFLALPLTYDNQNYGVLCFENLKKKKYSDADIDFLKRATKMFPFILYSTSNNSMLKSLVTTDLDTKFLNSKTFIKAIESELYKASKVEVPTALLLIQIDDFLEESSLFESDPFPKVLKSIASSIRDETNISNIVGRLSNRVFGVFFFNVSSKDVFLWAEKLRLAIARKPVAVISKQTTFTVSIGIANSTNKTEVEEVIYNAELALKKALEKGGNSVKNL